VCPRSLRPAGQSWLARACKAYLQVNLKTQGSEFHYCYENPAPVTRLLLHLRRSPLIHFKATELVH
jgi:hypothetical protein